MAKSDNYERAHACVAFAVDALGDGKQFGVRRTDAIVYAQIATARAILALIDQLEDPVTVLCGTQESKNDNHE